MKIDIHDKSLMMIILLEECNLTCAHCVREDEPMDPGYRLSFEQLQSCLSDCHSLEAIRWVHFSGGEPTLWKEGNRNLVHLLLQISEAGFTPGFTTNGSYFVDYRRCREFFEEYLSGSTMPLRLYLSIDTFHRNFAARRGRARILDNVIRCRQELPSAKADLLNINVLTVISKDPASLLPVEMVEYYESLGVTFGFVPLLLRGKTKSFSHLCPDLSSDNPDDLGAYYRFYREQDRKRQRRPGNRHEASFINLIGDDYYFDNPWRNVGQLGNLPETIIRAYSEFPQKN